MVVTVPDMKEASQSPASSLNPLALGSDIWRELFEIFQLHYSADLPFIHKPSFRKALLQSISPAATRDPLPAYMPQEWLLAFIALTARFHPILSKRADNPRASSEEYAKAARTELHRQDWESLGRGRSTVLRKLGRIQTLLMLTLHAWGMCQGETAWVDLARANAHAMTLGLQTLDDETDTMPEGIPEWRLAKQDRLRRPDMPWKSEEIIEQEIGRRTQWSCFIMDRYLSGGKQRQSRLDVEALAVQLPCDEEAFTWGKKRKTLTLGEVLRTFESPAEAAVHRRIDLGRDTTGLQDESLLSRFIQILTIYGEVQGWSCADGRRRYTDPPWEPTSKFDKLRQKVNFFKRSLPPDLDLDLDKVSAFDVPSKLTTYLCMHVLHLLCLIILHREYIPFVALNCQEGPRGPLDEPLFTPEQENKVGREFLKSFWSDSARECFQAARQLVDLVAECEKWDALVETPLTAFCIFQSAFVGVYAQSFPWMDPDGFMCARGKGQNGVQAARKAFDIIVFRMTKHLRMAHTWVETLAKAYRFYQDQRKEYSRDNKLFSDGENSSVESSPGFSGGRLDCYKRLESVLKEFGRLENYPGELSEKALEACHRTLCGDYKQDDDYDMKDTDADVLRQSQGNDAESDSGSAVKSEDTDMAEVHRESQSGQPPRNFTAVNNRITPAPTDSSGGTPVVPPHIPNAIAPRARSPPNLNPTQPQGHYAPHYLPSAPNTSVLPLAHPYPPNATESAQRATLDPHRQSQTQPSDHAEYMTSSISSYNQSQPHPENHFLTDGGRIGCFDLNAFTNGYSAIDVETMAFYMTPGNDPGMKTLMAHNPWAGSLHNPGEERPFAHIS